VGRSRSQRCIPRRIRGKTAAGWKATEIVARRRQHVVDRHLGGLAHKIGLGLGVSATSVADHKRSPLAEGSIELWLVVLAKLGCRKIKMTTDKADPHGSVLPRCLPLLVTDC
jgi:hypothetical protein